MDQKEFFLESLARRRNLFWNLKHQIQIAVEHTSICGVLGTEDIPFPADPWRGLNYPQATVKTFHSVQFAHFGDCVLDDSPEALKSPWHPCHLKIKNDTGNLADLEISSPLDGVFYYDSASYPNPLRESARKGLNKFFERFKVEEDESATLRQEHEWIALLESELYGFDSLTLNRDCLGSFATLQDYASLLGLLYSVYHGYCKDDFQGNKDAIHAFILKASWIGDALIASVFDLFGYWSAGKWRESYEQSARGSKESRLKLKWKEHIKEDLKRNAEDLPRWLNSQISRRKIDSWCAYVKEKHPEYAAKFKKHGDKKKADRQLRRAVREAAKEITGKILGVENATKIHG